MSTFDGLVSEFPRIRIDCFRRHPSQPPPLACFLSHMHSDHLQGLESLKAPFVYCSAATRHLLLRLEKYPHRINFARGVLESRKQHYRHLKSVLKAIPLNSPTEIELSPLEKIRVTLFDANHCPGAVMFLIEADRKAILYTGDIRAEPWWVESLVRNPVLLPYSTGLRRLDRMYLDTTFAVKDDLYQTFPSKAEGIYELLEKAGQYPPETLFYLNAWTTGYEEVWIALSSFLKCSVHVDDYRTRLYGSLSSADNGLNINQYSALTGFDVGNHHKNGCLTSKSTTRIHSCEPSTSCYNELQKSKHVVWITPIVTRSKEGLIVPELGAGDGGHDLREAPELELGNITSIRDLEELCKQQIEDPAASVKLLSKFKAALLSGDKNMALDGLDLNAEKDISLQEFLQRMSTTDRAQTAPVDEPQSCRASDPGLLSNIVHYPFSRHSSYTELCALVAAFKPADIYPCTVDEQSWTERVSMRALFGHLCTGAIFAQDEKMRQFRQRHHGLEKEGSPKKREENRRLDSQTDGSIDSPSRDYGNPLTYSDDESKDFRLTNEDVTPDRCLSPAQQIAAIRTAYECHMETARIDLLPLASSIDTSRKRKAPSPSTPSHGSESQVSISPSGFGSQSEEASLMAGRQVEESSGEGPSRAQQVRVRSWPASSEIWSRHDMRLPAYRAAKITVQSSDSAAWDELGIRSVGHMGHYELEEEL